MGNFEIIQAAMENITTSKAIKAKHLDHDDLSGPIRRFLAYALGTKGAGATEKVVLCYQYDGPNTQTPPSQKNWRCFKVDRLTSVAEINFNPTPTFIPPDPLKFRHLRKQNCIDDVDVWRRKEYVDS